jgi:hypothetical protein
MRSITVLLFVLFAFLFTLKSSVVGMLVYWWFAIFRPQDWIYLDVASFKLPLIAIALFIPPALIRGNRPRLNDLIAKLMLLWVLSSLVASFAVGCSEQFWLLNPYTQLPILMLAILLSADIVKTKMHLIYWVGTVGLSLGFYAGKSGLLALSRGGSSSYGASNLTGLFSGSNAYASGSAILVFFIILIFQITKNKEIMSQLPSLLKIIPVKVYQSILLLIIIGTIFNVISLESRASAIAMILAFLLWYGFSKNKAFLKMFLWAPVFVVALSFVPLPDGYEERIQSAFADDKNLDTSAASRPYFWNIAADMVADNPFGVGVNCYKVYYNLYDTKNIYGKYRDVHSSHFQVLSEIGYLGLIFWIWLNVLCFLRNNKIRKLTLKHNEVLPSAIFYRQISIMLMCSQFTFVISGAFYSLAYSDLIWIVFGLTIAQTKLFNQELDRINSKVD